MSVFRSAAGWRRAAVCTAVSAYFLLTYAALFLRNMLPNLLMEHIQCSQFPMGTRIFSGLDHIGHNMTAAFGLPAVPFPRNVHFPSSADSTSNFQLRDALATSSLDSNGPNGCIYMDCDVFRVLTPAALSPLPLAVPSVATADAVTPLPVHLANSNFLVLSILPTSAASCVSSRRPNVKKTTSVFSAMGLTMLNECVGTNLITTQQQQRHSCRSNGRRSSLGSRILVRYVFLMVGPLLIRIVSISIWPRPGSGCGGARGSERVPG